MTAALTLATEQHTDKVLAFMARYHEEARLPHSDDHRARATAPLLDASPMGAIWLIGPPIAPLGYVAITFGWSLGRGGMTATLAEAFIRPSVRGRGIGTEAMHAIMVQLSQAGITSFHAAPQSDQPRAIRFCERLKLTPDTGSQPMSS